MKMPDIHKVYSVYDSKAEAYLPMFEAVTRGVAVRMVQAAARRPEHDFSKFPGDYTLFEIGERNARTGRYKEFNAPSNLGTVLVIANLNEE